MKKLKRFFRFVSEFLHGITDRQIRAKNGLIMRVMVAPIEIESELIYAKILNENCKHVHVKIADKERSANAWWERVVVTECVGFTDQMRLTTLSWQQSHRCYTTYIPQLTFSVAMRDKCVPITLNNDQRLYIKFYREGELK